jgi:hypothetical protein
MLPSWDNVFGKEKQGDLWQLAKRLWVACVLTSYIGVCGSPYNPQCPVLQLNAKRKTAKGGVQLLVN